jgi:Domain of unknown function (DUF4249)
MKNYMLFVLIIFSSCQKIVTLKLNNAAPQTVIQGEITDAPGPYTITINQTVDFYSDNTFPPVSGATVKISDNTGVTDSLTEISPGVYSTHILTGKQGNTYSLTVLAQNVQYAAVSTMPPQVPLDSVTIQSQGGFGQQSINVVVNFQDPAGETNYYQFIESINGQSFVNNNFVFDDRLSDGKYISRTLRTDSSYIQKADLVEVKMYSVDENTYNYFLQLRQSSGRGAFNSTASPANPTSNISGGALGYFSAHTTQSKSVIAY